MQKTPRQLAEERIGMAEQYSKYSGVFAEMIKLRAEYYREEREKHKSDTACERAWERTEQGVQMTIIRLKLKSIEKQMSASNTMLRLLENEAKSLY